MSHRKLVAIFDPQAALKRGYAIINRGKEHITKAAQVKAGDKLSLQLSDGKIGAIAQARE